MHIKSDELDCIPDVTKVQGKNGQMNENVYIVRNTQDPNRSKYYMSLQKCHSKETMMSVKILNVLYVCHMAQK